jgi:hypothetical protein
MRGLQDRDDQCRSDRTDERDLAQQLPRVVGLGQSIKTTSSPLGCSNLRSMSGPRAVYLAFGGLSLCLLP